MSNLKHVSGEAALQLALAPSNLIVVDFFADWCSPCKVIAPEFEKMASENPDCIFLKVCENDSMDAMMARGVKAFPTFQLYIKGMKVAEMRGADPSGLRSLIAQHKVSAVGSFAGQGMTLGGPGASSRPEDVREARMRALGAGAGSRPAPKAAVVPVLDRASLASLQDMGLSEIRAARALLAAGGKSVEGAMEWLGEHQDDDGIDDEDDMVKAALRGAAAFMQADGSAVMSEHAPAVTAPAAGEAAMTAEERAEAQADADAEVAASAGGDLMDESAPAAPPRKLTAEETQARVRAIRAAKAAKAKEEERLREISRREGGQKALEAAEMNKALQRQAEIDRIKREKEAGEREKLRLQIDIMKDKAERESRQQGRVSEETAAKLKALQEGKPMPGAADPLAIIKKSVAAMSMQKKDAVGRLAAELLLKLVGNVCTNPGDDKFRELKGSMRAVKEKLLVAPPSITLLVTCGFVKEGSGDDMVLRMSKDHAAGEAGQAVMKAALADLQAALDAKAFD